eukprot:TRINITY_DN420_c0_g1_i1.p2 TRINITY_DN420_c0_g1~~TRINITY_DN420_c0_g1_i1.p2  ORF type:complete len:460 (-),score=103.63 TRINITY_DN420_c0_g1_i1:692-2071(-)
MCSIFVYLYFILSFVVCQKLPNEYERVFKGEGGTLCQDTFARVDASSQSIKVTNESAIEAVTQAFTQYIKDIQSPDVQEIIIADQYTTGGESSGAAVIGTAQKEPLIIDAAAAGSELILDVVAEAIATVKIDINSPNKGCWAIGFGQAEAKAEAEAVITAVAQAFAAAETSGTVASTKLAAENVEKDLQVAVEQIAIHLAAGDGSGQLSKNASVLARVKATAVNCALSKAFSAISEEGEQVIGFAQAGCIEQMPMAMAAMVARPFFLRAPKETCGCQKNGEYGAPNLCGPWGDSGNGDTICYVDRTNGSCACALPSIRYPGATWRYCGKTQAEMQEWLKIDEADSFGEGLGYCPDWNTAKDEIVIPQSPSPPPPSPSPSPPPPSPPPPPALVQPIKECPRFKCFADARSCCDVEEDICKSRFGREYRFEGVCGELGLKVWNRVDGNLRSNSRIGQCYCP